MKTTILGIIPGVIFGAFFSYQAVFWAIVSVMFGYNSIQKRDFDQILVIKQFKSKSEPMNFELNPTNF